MFKRNAAKESPKSPRPSTAYVPYAIDTDGGANSSRSPSPHSRNNHVYGKSDPVFSPANSPLSELDRGWDSAGDDYFSDKSPTNKSYIMRATKNTTTTPGTKEKKNTGRKSTSPSPSAQPPKRATSSRRGQGGKAYLSINQYLRKAGVIKTLNVYYRNITSTHYSVQQSLTGEDEVVDEIGCSMIDAARRGDVTHLKFLVAQMQKDVVGACVGERLGSLMLHLAAENGHTSMVRYLITDLWVDVNSSTSRGMTACHYASKANRLAVVRELAMAGADLMATNDIQQMPVQMTSDRVMKRLFLQYGAGSVTRPLRDKTANGKRVVEYMCIMTLSVPQVSESGKRPADNETVDEDGSDMTKIVNVVRVPAEDHAESSPPLMEALIELLTCDLKGGGSGSVVVGKGKAFTTVLTDSTGGRSYATCCCAGTEKVVNNVIPPLARSAPPPVLLVCVVVALSQRPYMGLFSRATNQIAQMINCEAEKWGGISQWPLDLGEPRNNDIKSALEYYSSQLPLPQLGQRVEKVYRGCNLEYGDTSAAHRGLPYMDPYCAQVLFKCLSPETILEALACLMQEQSVLLLASDISLLAPASEALLGLLYPLEWPHSWVPVLPPTMSFYLEAPVPFLMGISIQHMHSITSDLSSIVLINLSTDSIVHPIHPILNTDKNTSLAELPVELSGECERLISRCVPAALAPKGKRPPQPRELRARILDIPGIRVAMTDLMLALVGRFQTLRYADGAKERMINDVQESWRPMLSALLSSQLWQLFRDDCVEETVPGRKAEREDQVQLFCECVESFVAKGTEDTCTDILYPHGLPTIDLIEVPVPPSPTVPPASPTFADQLRNHLTSASITSVSIMGIDNTNDKNDAEDEGSGSLSGNESEAESALGGSIKAEQSVDGEEQQGVPSDLKDNNNGEEEKSINSMHVTRAGSTSRSPASENRKKSVEVVMAGAWDQVEASFGSITAKARALLEERERGKELALKEKEKQDEDMLIESLEELSPNLAKSAGHDHFVLKPVVVSTTTGTSSSPPGTGGWSSLRGSLSESFRRLSTIETALLPPNPHTSTSPPGHRPSMSSASGSIAQRTSEKSPNPNVISESFGDGDKDNASVASMKTSVDNSSVTSNAETPGIGKLGLMTASISERFRRFSMDPAGKKEDKATPISSTASTSNSISTSTAGVAKSVVEGSGNGAESGTFQETIGKFARKVSNALDGHFTDDEEQDGKSSKGPPTHTVLQQRKTSANAESSDDKPKLKRRHSRGKSSKSVSKDDFWDPSGVTFSGDAL